MTMWLVHPVGEADLCLDARAGQREAGTDGSRHWRSRLELLRRTVDGGDRVRLRRLVVDGRWDDDVPTTHRRPPLAAALAALDDGVGEAGATVRGSGSTPFSGGIRLVLLTTRQASPHILDTHAVGVVLREAILRDEGLLPVDPAGVLVAQVRSLAEADVLAGLREVFGGVPQRGDLGAVTWASGSSSLALAAVTALVEQRLSWRLVELPEDGPARVIDPLDRLDVDPVVAMLVRWRLFPQLARLAAGPSAPVLLDERQRQVVGRLAERWALGYQAASVDALRGLVADAVVRGDGTAGLAVRRYVEHRYREMLAAEDGAQDLLAWAATHAGRPCLGAGVDFLRSGEARAAKRVELARPSARWLTGQPVQALIELGKLSSHQLAAATPTRALAAARELVSGSCLNVEARDLREVGLPAAPVTPGLTVFATWVAGLPRPGDRRLPVGAALLEHGIGRAVREHLNVDTAAQKAGVYRAISVSMLVLATAGSPESLQEARDQQRALSSVGSTPRAPEIGRVTPQTATLPAASQARERDAATEALLDQHVPAEAGALVMIPTGPKAQVLPVVRALRRIGARRGLPLFVQEMAVPPDDGPQFHLWPASVEGDLPLLVAAREAIVGLELDAACRLLAATSVADPFAVRCRELANAAACRQADDDEAWPEALRDGPGSARRDRAAGMLGERLCLVRQTAAEAERAGSDAVVAVRIRYLVLAACATEVSCGQPDPDLDGRSANPVVRCKLDELAAGSGPDAEAVRVLRILMAARDASPVTRGSNPDPDAAVRVAAAQYLAKSSPLRQRLVDVPTLLDATVDAAEHLVAPFGGITDVLVRLRQALLGELSRELLERQRSGGPTGPQ